LRQDHVTDQGGMLSVVKQLVVENSVPALGPEHFGTIDQYAAVPRRNVAVDLKKRARAPNWKSVEIARPDIMVARLVIRPILFQQTPQPEVDFGKLGFLLQNRSVLSHALLWILLLDRAGFLKSLGELITPGSGDSLGEHAPIGLEAR